MSSSKVLFTQYSLRIVFIFSFEPNIIKASFEVASQDLQQTAPSSLEWYCHQVKGKDEEECPYNKPKPRSCHTLTVVGANAFMFGGMVGWSSDDPDISLADIPDEEMAKPSDELFKLELSSKSRMEWSLVKTVGASTAIKSAMTKPSARWRHSATLFDNSHILIFGGFQTSDHRLNDVWVFDTISRTWSQPNVSVIPSFF